MKKTLYLFTILLSVSQLACEESLQTDYAPLPLSEAETQLVKETEKLGRRIYEKDICAAIATDLLFDEIIVTNSKGVLGWITCKKDNGYVVLFVTQKEQEFSSPYQVIFDGNKQPQIIRQNRPLSHDETNMFRARQQAINIITKACTDKYNTVVLSMKEGSGWLLYALAATTDPQAIVIGGHYKAVISRDGKTVLSQRPFTKDCMTLSTNPPDMPPGAELAGLSSTHILDDTPTEIHVFISLLYKKLYLLATKDGRLWKIDGDKIELIKKL